VRFISRYICFCFSLITNLLIAFLTPNLFSANNTPPQIQIPLKLDKGWNLFSLPVTPPDFNKEDFFQGKVMGRLWTFTDNHFHTANTIESGKGYWVFLREKIEIVFSYRPGQQNSTSHSQTTFNQGWNLSGIISPVSPPQQSVGSVWYYANGRFRVAGGILNPGVGYWINLAETSNVFLGSLDTDSDNDEIPDYWEALWGFQYTSSDDRYFDPDVDELTNFSEFTAGANPLNSDTDDDGLMDAEEVKIYRTHPFDADTDGDGIADGEEVMQGMNPLPGTLVLLIDDQNGFENAGDILRADNHIVITFNNEFNDGRSNLLDTDFLNPFDLVVWAARGDGFGTKTSPEVAASLESYIQTGGNLLVTGFDSLGSPQDIVLADLVRATLPANQGSMDPNWQTADLDNFILNGRFGDFRSLTFSSIGYDDDFLIADTSRGAMTLAVTPGQSDRIIFTQLPLFGGSIGYWNGGRSGLTTNAQPDFSSGGVPQDIFRNWVAGVTKYQLGDRAAPIIEVRLVNDTGVSTTDRVTSDPTISGTVTDVSTLIGFRAGFDDNPLSLFADVLEDLQPDGSFTFDLARLSHILAPYTETPMITTETEPNDNGDPELSLADLPFANDLTRRVVSIGSNQYQAIVTGDTSGMDGGDLFKIQASPGDILNVELQGSIYHTLRLFNNMGSQMASNLELNSRKSIFTNKFIYKGDYYIAVNQGYPGYSLTATITSTTLFPERQHTLHLQAVDEDGNVSKFFDFDFTLDTTSPAPLILHLGPNPNTWPGGDMQTWHDAVGLVGRTEMNSSVELEPIPPTIDDFESYFFIPDHFTTTNVVIDKNDINSLYFNEPILDRRPWRGFGPASNDLIRATLGHDLFANDFVISGNLSGLYSLRWPVGSGFGRSFASARYLFGGATDLIAQSLVAAKFRSTNPETQTHVRLVVSNNLTTYLSTAIMPLTDEVQEFIFKLSDSDMFLAEGPDSFSKVISGVINIGFMFQSREGQYYETIILDDFVFPTMPTLAQAPMVTTSDSDGNFGFPIVPLLPGPNGFTVRVTDLAGNERLSSQTVTRVLPPVINPSDLPFFQWKFEFPIIRSPHSDPITLNKLTAYMSTVHYLEGGGSDGLHKIISITISDPSNGNLLTATISESGQWIVPRLGAFSGGGVSINSGTLIVEGEGTNISLLNTGQGNETFSLSVSGSDPSGSRFTSYGIKFFDNGAFNYHFNRGSFAELVQVSEKSGTEVMFTQALPTIAAFLLNDTGTNATDNITSDPTISGSITNAHQIIRFRAGFDETPTENFVDILSDLQADAHFTLTPERLEQIKGSSLDEGQHTLHLRVYDVFGRPPVVVDVDFTLSLVAP